jgi:nitrite reductase (NADH) large subunit
MTRVEHVPERLIIIGNGMASVRFCEDMLRHARGRFSITVIGAEPKPGYNRVLLSSHLAGETSEADLTLKPRQWYDENGIILLTGALVTAVNAGEKTVTLDTGDDLTFDKLVFATGSEPVRLAKPGMALAGVITFRDLADVRALKALPAGSKAVVIGGGLLGLEAAWGLKRAGADVTVIHLMDRLMERQLDDKAAAVLRTALEAKGISFKLSSETVAVHGTSQIEAVELADGSVLAADLLCVAVGIVPRKTLAAEAGCATGRAIIVNDHLETSVPGIYAIGECAEHQGIAYGLVEPAYAQARILAQHMAGDTAHYGGSLLYTNLKVSGVAVFSAGDMQGQAGDDIVTFEDKRSGHYRKLIVRDSTLKGAILVGDASDSIFYRDLILSGAPIASIRDRVIFGEAYCITPLLKAA